MIKAILMSGVGLAVLILGAEFLVRGAVQVSHRLGIPLIIVGLTIVAFGTSAPELAVTILSTMEGKPDLAVGNVVGSNLFNVLVVLGLSALIFPVKVHKKLVQWDVPFSAVGSLLLLFFVWNGVLSRWEGLFLCGGLIVFLGSQYFFTKEQASEEAAEYLEKDNPEKSFSWLKIVTWIIFGVAGLSFGTRWFVFGAIDLAQIAGIDDLVIGLTFLALGTSLPELATSVLAALRKQSDIVVGNVIGSNIFNLFGVLGVAAALGSEGLSISKFALYFDVPALLFLSLACFPILWSGLKVDRFEGVCFFLLYLTYAYSLFFRKTSPFIPENFGAVLTLAALPLGLLVVYSLVVNARASQKKP